MSKAATAPRRKPSIHWMAAASMEYLQDTQNAAFIVQTLAEPLLSALDEASGKDGDGKIDIAGPIGFFTSVEWLFDVLESRSNHLREGLLDFKETQQ